MFRFILVGTALLTFVGRAAAAEEPAAAPALSAPGAWTMELGGEVTREAWNYNLSDEDLWGGSAHVWYRMNRHWSIGSELLLIWVHQERVRSTPIAGFSIAGRREFPVATQSFFVETAAGLSYAARFVPQRGTRFNYVAEIAGGVIRPLGKDSRLIASLRWLHLSNSGVASRARNPDIQALGVRVAVMLPLQRLR